MSAAVIALLLTVTVVSLTAARRIAAEARRTEQNARELRLNLYVADMNLAYQAVLDNNLGLARQTIGKYFPEPQDTQDGTMIPATEAGQDDLRGWEWRYLWSLCKGDSIATLRGHTGSVTCAIFSPDGKTLVTASFDRTVRIWDVAARRTMHALTGFADQLLRNSVAISPDGRTLVVADGTDIHVFETASWSKVRRLPNKTASSYLSSLPIAFSPDGKILSCNADSEIRHWDTTSWERRPSQPTSLMGEFGRVLAYSSDRRHFVTTSDDEIVIWDTFSNPPRRRSIGQIHRPTAVIFSPDGRWVAAVGTVDQAVLLDVAEGKEIMRLSLGESFTQAGAVAWSPDGRRLAIGGFDQILRLWDIQQGRLSATLKGAHGEGDALAFSPDGKTLVSACGDGTASLFSTVPAPTSGSTLTAGNHICFSADGTTLAVFSTNSSVEYWNVRSRTLVRSFKIPVSLGERDSVASSPDGSLVAHLCTEGMARIWHVRTGEQVAAVALDPPPKWPWSAFSPDSRLVALSCDARIRGGGGWTLVWDFQRGQGRKLPGDDVYRPSFSPDGRMLATGLGNDVQVWSVPDLKPLATFKGHTGTISGMGFSPDSALLASIGRDSVIRLWDVATGRSRLFNAHASGNGLTYAAFSLDGKTLVSGSNVSPDFWNVAAGKKVLPMKDTPRYLGGPMFSPDGRALSLGAKGGRPFTGPVELLWAPSLEEIEAAEKAEREPP